MESKLAEIDELSRDLGPNPGSSPQFGAGPPFGGEGPGDVFVKSEGYKRIADSATRGGNWTSGGVEVPMSTKGGGLTVEASNSHSTYFQTNMLALSAEERLALAVFRPSAFTAVVGVSS